ncbi:MAG: hypothetical protein R6X08_03830 [Desulfosalsimonadaceae bacterium]
MLFRRKKTTRKARFSSALKSGFGVDTHRAGWSIIKSPVEVLHNRKKTGEDPEKLRQLDFYELLHRWGIPRDKVPRLKRTLVFEMCAYIALACLGFFSVAYRVFNPDYSLVGVLLGLMIGTAAFLQFLLRHHWYLILVKQKYRSFRDYLLRRESK